MKTVLVTGGKGQLAHCLKDLTKNSLQHAFLYVDYDELDIANKQDVEAYFAKHKIDYCINCAAYTAVDKAEAEPLLAQSVNANGAKHLALACQKHKAVLIQISTDFVFDGKHFKPYVETDQANPISVYGQTKLEGEQAVSSILDQCFIFRTSWLYSEYGNNYLKTMLKLAQVKDELNIITDQVGTPTYAGDLAAFILKLVEDNATQYGTYHYSNEGVASWYDFTKAIFRLNHITTKVNPIKSEAYKQAAKRPMYSVLDKSNTKTVFNIEVPYWVESLSKVLNEINK